MSGRKIQTKCHSDMVEQKMLKKYPEVGFKDVRAKDDDRH
jgi:hypothetical protein